MIMTRPLYSDLEFFRRTDRGIHMPLSQNSQVHDQYDAASHLSNRTTPLSEPDSRASSGSRKRVPVACERCRKRKIKCSGNEGDSKACVNCKNSGLEESCYFLRVQSFNAHHLGFRDSYASHRYSPYPVSAPHRSHYVPGASRYAPQSTLHYHHPLPSSVEYGAYASHNAAVDWRPSYPGEGGPYSPYPDEEESSPYTTQPPSYMLPNTDPMSTNNHYYVHGLGVRPHPGTLWPEPQQFLSNPTSQLSNVPYTMSHEFPQLFQPVDNAGTLTQDRLLPQPITARSYLRTPASSVDLAVSHSNQRSHNYWHGDVGTSVHQLPTPATLMPSQGHTISRESNTYRAQDISCSLPSPNEGLSVTSASASTYRAGIEAPAPAVTTTTEDLSSQPPTLSLINPGSQQTNMENPNLAYNHPTQVPCHNPQLRRTSGQLRPELLYCQTNILPRRNSGSEDCSPDCTSCHTESTRTSFTSANSNSASC